ncbi:hypothetical protein QOZ80_4BG0335640 [Eleusine coracana subsp. coracana]|nr:hypothetical protein QOZ80_4BG0335640 [Eleusine coracana subsp. coracana]
MAGSSETERAVSESGEGELALLTSLDYTCTARLRLHRLLAYLRRHSCPEVYQPANEKMRVIFHARELVKKVKGGQWREAALYVLRFAPFSQSGFEGRHLVLFLQDFMALNDFTDGHMMAPRFLCNWFASIYKKPVLDKYPCFATMVADVLFMRNDHARAFLDWHIVRNKAAKVVEQMAYKMPELRDRLHYPRGQNDLYHVLPIGSRRHMRKADRKQSTHLAQFYLQMKKRLPSSDQEASYNYCSARSSRIEGEVLMELLEEALQAGRCMELEQAHPPEYSSKDGFPFVQTVKALGHIVRLASSSKQGCTLNELASTRSASYNS